MFYAIWLLLIGITLSTWLCSTLHVIYYKLEPNIAKPWPLVSRNPEERFKVLLLTWAYFPTLLAKMAWKDFSTSEKGSTLMEWLRKKI
ncbi:MAG: hypothetical protein GY714_01770 [Desulfobacterales bacterium]|nr:hypothetical protein [Desulfobacterales bacterium]